MPDIFSILKIFKYLRKNYRVKLGNFFILLIWDIMNLWRTTFLIF